MRNGRLRFWLEAACAVCSGFLGLLTIVWHDWIEGVFGVDPDHHSGWLEWLIVAVLLAVSLASTLAARVEWRRIAPATAAADHQ